MAKAAPGQPRPSRPMKRLYQPMRPGPVSIHISLLLVFVLLACSNPASAFGPSRGAGRIDAVVPNNAGHVVEEASEARQASRRSVLAEIGGLAMAAALAVPPLSADASGDVSHLDPDAVAAGNDDSAYPPVTHRVFMDVRISRSDGTFYVRDDLPDAPENRVFTGRLTLGLFGAAAPNHVRQFLRYVDAPYNPADDSPLPSYGRSTFARLDQDTGLLAGGNIPGLELTEIGGGTNMRYGGRILPAPLWIESSSREGGQPPQQPPRPRRVSHSLGSGLLTHRTLDPLPTFGITTRPAPELDPTHVVFGRVLPDPSSRDFLRACVDLPTYSMDRPSVPAEVPRTAGERAAEAAASRVFAAQRELFRGAARTFGDSRLDNVYEGKLLRRVEVTRVGLL